jgi:hypothetical protein
MKFWDDIKNYFYRRSLEQKLALVKVEHSLISLENAHTVGILFDSTQAVNDTTVLQFAEQLRNAGKQVELLGFVNDKKTEAKPGMAIFNRKNLSWAEVPQSEAVEKFAAQNFDLLLACFTGGSLPLEYVVGISKALWRVGVYTESKTGLYDMMVNMGGKNDIAYLLEQSAYFLNYIKAA